MGRTSTAIAAIAVVIVIAPALPGTVAGLTQRVRAASELRNLPVDARAPAILGWQEHLARDLRARTGPDDPIDLVMATDAARDLAVLTATRLAPRPIRFFQGMEAWRRRERAAFFHDRHAANAPNRTPPGPAAITVVLDPLRDPPYRLLDEPRR